MIQKWFALIRRGAARFFAAFAVPMSHRDALFIEDYRELRRRRDLEAALTRASQRGHRI